MSHIHWFDKAGICRICKQEDTAKGEDDSGEFTLAQPKGRPCLSAVSSMCEGHVYGTKEERICHSCKQVLSKWGYL